MHRLLFSTREIPRQCYFFFLAFAFFFAMAYEPPPVRIRAV